MLLSRRNWTTAASVGAPSATAPSWPPAARGQHDDALEVRLQRRRLVDLFHPDGSLASQRLLDLAERAPVPGTIVDCGTGLGCGPCVGVRPGTAPAAPAVRSETAPAPAETTAALRRRAPMFWFLPVCPMPPDPTHFAAALRQLHARRSTDRRTARSMLSCRSARRSVPASSSARRLGQRPANPCTS